MILCCNIGSALPTNIVWTTPNLTITCQGDSTTDVTITATDNEGLETTHTINIVSEFANNAPTVVGIPADHSVEENQTFSQTWDIKTYFDDVDENDTLVYTSTIPTFLTGSILSGVLTLSGTPNETNVGEYVITLRASDG